ncbi:MAG TPA: hypothetical protein VJ180_09100 [Pyrinomonadaceae bacterium]|nr:hypothetical protein [Pyrinomonadaceae bacterium]
MSVTWGKTTPNRAGERIVIGLLLVWCGLVAGYALIERLWQ